VRACEEGNLLESHAQCVRVGSSVYCVLLMTVVLCLLSQGRDLLYHNAYIIRVFQYFKMGQSCLVTVVVALRRCAIYFLYLYFLYIFFCTNASALTTTYKQDTLLDINLKYSDSDS